jgi:hypothetical protein
LALKRADCTPAQRKATEQNGERFLDTVAIELGLGNGEFGSRVAHCSEDQEENAGRQRRWL